MLSFMGLVYTLGRELDELPPGGFLGVLTVGSILSGVVCVKLVFGTSSFATHAKVVRKIFAFVAGSVAGLLVGSVGYLLVVLFRASLTGEHFAALRNLNVSIFAVTMVVCAVAGGVAFVKLVPTKRDESSTEPPERV